MGPKSSPIALKASQIDDCKLQVTHHQAGSGAIAPPHKRSGPTCFIYLAQKSGRSPGSLEACTAALTVVCFCMRYVLWKEGISLGEHGLQPEHQVWKGARWVLILVHCQSRSCIFAVALEVSVSALSACCLEMIGTYSVINLGYWGDVNCLVGF